MGATECDQLKFCGLDCLPGFLLSAMVSCLAVHQNVHQVEASTLNASRKSLLHALPQVPSRGAALICGSGRGGNWRWRKKSSTLNICITKSLTCVRRRVHANQSACVGSLPPNAARSLYLVREKSSCE